MANGHGVLLGLLDLQLIECPVHVAHSMYKRYDDLSFRFVGYCGGRTWDSVVIYYNKTTKTSYSVVT